MGWQARLSILVGLSLAACGETATTASSVTITSDSATADSGLDAAAADAATDAGDITADTSSDSVEPIGDPACWSACTKLGGSVAVCGQACASNDSCDQVCVTTATTLGEMRDCLGNGLTGKAFLPGPYGSDWRSTAGDVMFTTEEGDWSLQDHWTGRDNYVFLFEAAGFTYADQLWKSSVKTWLKGTPGNVHFFFATLLDKTGSNSAQVRVDAIHTAVDKALQTLDERSKCLWQRRIHYGSVSANEMGGTLLDALKASGGQAAMGIDQLQNWRQVGLLQTVGGAPELKMLGYQVRGWNFEAAREAQLAAQKAVIIPLHSWLNGSHFTADFELPAGVDISQYDTLQFDVAGWCKDHKDENCSEWDSTAFARLCEMPLGPNADAATKCQQQVGEVVEVKEVLGLCGDTTATCKLDAECADGGACKGFVAAVAPVKGIAADTKVCQCSDVDGKPVDHKRTCKGDGSGYGDCECPCPVELGRWITPYHREGRWVSDATPALTWLGKPGKHRISFDASNLPMVDFFVRLSNQGSGLRPVQSVELFHGGGFNQDYNKKYKPLTVNVPADVKKVELYAIISGHGWGAEAANCAEFCNHTHHFGINGTDFVKEHPLAGTAWGCADQIELGALPDQFGTWQLGRGGWCPGMDVKPMRVDVTAAVQPGKDNTLTYKALFNGAEYQPASSGQQTNGFGAVIEMSSWLVFYK